MMQDEGGFRDATRVGAMAKAGGTSGADASASDVHERGAAFAHANSIAPRAAKAKTHSAGPPLACANRPQHRWAMFIARALNPPLAIALML
jgi:hypothetical protein